MRIKDVRLYIVSTTIKYKDVFWEERLLRPIDIYPEHDTEGPGEWNLVRINSDLYKVRGTFIEIESDEGLKGIFGPLGAPIGDIEAFIISRRLKPLLIGSNPFEIEKLWDKMYRLLVHGRKGYAMMAISAVDCALWDLLGKALNKPVYALLGGPTRDKVQAYASMLGFSVDPSDVGKRAMEYAERGFKYQKWFMRYGPQHGVKGFEKNVGLVKAIRDAIGYDVDIMIDAWMSWNVDYSFKMACALDRYEVLWLEEPLMPDDLAGYIQLSKKIRSAGLSIKLAGGEHEYTRWGFKTLIDNQIFDVLQPDIAWAGGITEVLKICSIASANALQVIPHTAVMAATLHLAFSLPATVVPLAEYLVKWNIINQAVYETQYHPMSGAFEAPKLPGLGLEFRRDAKKMELKFPFYEGILND
ncbi:mandelate racemase/muconate lactonizing protein [Nanoarchaeota archaeon]|nr:MAG: mandelate racemase/muconate lactonizing protein [Nanoarchaeota archaeon]